MSHELPNDKEAETTVLGAILVDNEQMASAEAIVASGDFYVPANRETFKAMQALSQKGAAMDLVTVKGELARAGTLEMCGGVAFVASLIEGMPRVSSIDQWATIVKEKAIARDLVKASNAIAARAMKCEAEAIEMVGQSMNDILAVADRANGSGGFISPVASAKAAMAWWDQLVVADGGIVGLRTGLTKFDIDTGGLKPQQLIVVGGRPGMGKSAWAVTVGDNAAVDHGKKVAYFSLEMSHEELTMRRIAKRSGLYPSMLRELPEKMKASAGVRVAKAYDQVSSSSFFIDDEADLTIQQIRARARRLRAEKGLDVIIVDYLQLVKGEKWAGNREQEVSGVSRALKQLAKELDVPVIALCQLNRDLEKREDKRPQLSDLRESGGIEQDSDIIAFLYREHVHNPSAARDSAEIIVRKQRNGSTFTTPLTYIPETTTFTDRMVKEAAA